MKILPVLLTYCCIALLCLSLAACSSHTKKFAGQTDASDSANLAEVEENSVSEPEETAGEELEALKGLSAKQKMTLEQAGIDATKYDFPIVLNEQVQYYLDLFQGKQRNYYTHWLARSTAYRPYIEAELKKAGLPSDLVFLAMIESGYNPSAYSPANACGLWQFIAGTARTYGLKIDSWVDERREPEKATKAAIRYLSKLHKQFDNWYLAVAAYNTGEKRIADVIETLNTKNFWEIAESESLYLETKRYVPKLIAAIIIGREPEKYGFTEIDYHSPRQYEQIPVPGGISLEAVAVTTHTPMQHLRTLNNELRKNQTPPNGQYTLKIPVGTRELVAANLDNLKPATRTAYTTHTVKFGDTLTAICNLYNVSKTTLLKANNLRTANLKTGQHLQIPTTQYMLAKQDQQQQLDDSTQSQKTTSQQVGQQHRVKAKETLVSIAKQYKVSVNDLMRWNKITNQNEIKFGQKLTIGTTESASQALVVPAVLVTKSTKTAVTPRPSSPPILAVIKKQRVAPASQPVVNVAKPSTNTVKKSIQRATTPPTPAQPIWYVVKNGDTLLTISRKFNISPQDLRKLNKLSASTLQTGNKLLVKKG